MGAKLGKYSFEKEAGPNRSFDVEIIIAEEVQQMKDFVGKEYLDAGKLITYTFNKLQSFTLTRFMPPELMKFEGRAIVIDPDIFALPGTNLDELFSLDLEGSDMAAYRRKREAWESSLMVLDCEKLKHWKLDSILKELQQKKRDITDFMWLKTGESIKELSWVWNSLDSVENGAKILHTTRRLTQPWKTGLPINFKPKPMPKYFGFIPREPIHKLIGTYPTHFLPHPDKKVVDFFFTLTKHALEDGAVAESDIRREIQKGNVRTDLFDMLNTY